MAYKDTTAYLMTSEVLYGFETEACFSRFLNAHCGICEPTNHDG